MLVYGYKLSRAVISVPSRWFAVFLFFPATSAIFYIYHQQVQYLSLLLLMIIDSISIWQTQPRIFHNHSTDCLVMIHLSPVEASLEKGVLGETLNSTMLSNLLLGKCTIVFQSSIVPFSCWQVSARCVYCRVPRYNVCLLSVPLFPSQNRASSAPNYNLFSFKFHKALGHRRDGWWYQQQRCCTFSTLASLPPCGSNWNTPSSRIVTRAIPYLVR